MLQVGGKGMSRALVAEVDNALEHHELIKVKVAAEDREARDAMIAELAKRTDAALVQRIGHTAILYRPSKDNRQIVLPRGLNPSPRKAAEPAMQLNLERPDYEFFLRGADGRGALVNERTLDRSFIIAPDTLIEDWPVRDATAHGGRATSIPCWR